MSKCYICNKPVIDNKLEGYYFHILCEQCGEYKIKHKITILSYIHDYIEPNRNEISKLLKNATDLGYLCTIEDDIEGKFVIKWIKKD